jgi:hypothetical protein
LCTSFSWVFTFVPCAYVRKLSMRFNWHNFDEADGFLVNKKIYLEDKLLR